MENTCDTTDTLETLKI